MILLHNTQSSGYSKPIVAGRIVSRGRKQGGVHDTKIGLEPVWFFL